MEFLHDDVLKMARRTNRFFLNEPETTVILFHKFDYAYMNANHKFF